MAVESCNILKASVSSLVILRVPPRRIQKRSGDAVRSTSDRAVLGSSVPWITLAPAASALGVRSSHVHAASLWTFAKRRLAAFLTKGLRVGPRFMT